MKTKKTQLPPLLNANPDIVRDILLFCQKNIDDLNVDALHQHLLTELLPRLVNKIQSEQNADAYSLTQLLAEYNLKTLNLETFL